LFSVLLVGIIFFILKAMFKDVSFA
jgi:hypothetical protein